MFPRNCKYHQSAWEMRFTLWLGGAFYLLRNPSHYWYKKCLVEQTWCSIVIILWNFDKWTFIFLFDITSSMIDCVVIRFLHTPVGRSRKSTSKCISRRNIGAVLWQICHHSTKYSVILLDLWLVIFFYSAFVFEQNIDRQN